MPVTQFSHGPSKIAKSIRKKKGPNSTTALHANSRDARRLNRATLRDEKLYRHAMLRERENEKYLQRISFFRTAAETTLEAHSLDLSSAAPADDFSWPFTLPLLLRLVNTYISRYDAELDSLNASRRPGRPASTRETHLRDLRKEDGDEFKAGFWIPDLRDRRTVEVLVLRWGGGWSELGGEGWRWIRISGGGKGEGDADGEVRVRESRFPPRGGA